VDHHQCQHRSRYRRRRNQSTMTKWPMRLFAWLRRKAKEQEASIKRLYPEYTKLQFATADQLAGKLDNEYLARTRGVVGEELTAASAPNAIEARLMQDAESELALGPVTEPGAATPSDSVGKGGVCGKGHGDWERGGGRGDS
jgi:hypothetical protein